MPLSNKNDVIGKQSLIILIHSKEYIDQGKKNRKANTFIMFISKYVKLIYHYSAFLGYQHKKQSSEIAQNFITNAYQFLCYQTYSQLILMEYQARISNKPSHYAKIPLSKRIALVEQVIGHAFSIGKVAKRLNIKTSTAKLIIKKYKEDGTYFEKRSDRLSRLAQTKESAPIVPSTQISFLPTPPISLATVPQPGLVYDLNSSFQDYSIGNPPFVILGEGSEMVCYPYVGFNNLSVMATQFGSFY